MSTATATHTRDVLATTLPDWETVKWHANLAVANSDRFWSEPMRRRYIKRVARSYNEFVDSLRTDGSPHDKFWRDDPTGEEAVNSVMVDFLMRKDAA